VQMVQIYQNVEKIVCVLEEECTDETCPRMGAGKHVHYSWADEANPVPRALSAPKYCNTLLAYAEMQLADRTLLPIDGSPVPKEFIPVAKTLCKRFFRVYAHAYLNHYELLAPIVAHVNFSFKQFLFVALDFKLVEPKEMDVLRDMVDALMLKANRLPECQEEDEEDQEYSNDKEEDEEDQEYSNDKDAQGEQLRRVTALKSTLNSARGSSGVILHVLESLKSLGDLSFSVLKTTTIGHVVSGLAQDTANDENVRETAKALVQSWKSSYRQSIGKSEDRRAVITACAPAPCKNES